MDSIIISNLNFSYSKDKLFDDAFLKIDRGEICCLIGENGSGKSTFLKILANIIPCEMKLDFFNYANTEIKKVIKYIGYIPDKPFLYEELTGKENIEYMMFVFKENKNQYIEKVKLLCKKLNISDALDIKVKKYSLGMKHKLFFASIIARDTRLLLLDEPLTALDFESQQMAIKVLKKLSSEGVAVLFTSHIEQLQRDLATNIYNIINKKIVLRSEKMKNIVI